MIAALALLQAITAPPAAAPTPVPPPVSDWAALPRFPLARTSGIADASTYVRAEVEAGRCDTAVTDEEGASLVAPVAILVGDGGAVRRIVPRAIDCPTVEQYTVGYLLSLTRPDPDSPLLPPAGWYKLDVTYRW